MIYTCSTVPEFGEKVCQMSKTPQNVAHESHNAVANLAHDQLVIPTALHVDVHVLCESGTKL